MTFNYYHGTSSIFIKSILNNGLGSINPNINYKNLELLKYIFDYCKKTLTNEPKFNSLFQEITLAMIKQTDLIIKYENNIEKKFNFRHKKIYVSLSEFRAVSYPIHNQIGSEILQRCYNLHQLLLLNEIEIKLPDSLNYYKIDKIDLSTIKPILIKIDKIEYDNLIQENGYEAKPFLEHLENVYYKISEKDKFEKFQLMNFEIKKPIKSNLLKAYRIKYSGSIKEQTFKYRLIEY